jgi:rfaE bifunctional protein nucleotidyltransferase chain/domain
MGIVVPSTNAARVQETHVAVAHILSEVVESLSFSGQVESMAIPKGTVSWSDVLVLREEWKRQGRIVVWTNGCFDILHRGHVYALEQAKNFGDVLVVGVNDDASVRALKGPDRPIFPLEERMQLLAALQATDYVVPFQGVTPEAVLAELKPDVHVKGADYAPPSGKAMPERSVVESYGGRIEFVPLLPSHSTSDLLERIRNRKSGS